MCSFLRTPCNIGRGDWRCWQLQAGLYAVRQLSLSAACCMLHVGLLCWRGCVLDVGDSRAP